MTTRLAIAHLGKSYASVRALEDVCLEISEGCVFGLIGRNGAGKSTMFNCVLGLLRPTLGDALFDGKPLSPVLLEDIAYVPEMPALYRWMTANEHLEMFRRSYRRFDRVFARELTATFELPLSRRLRSLSKGQQQAVALILAFARRPALMILDEPAFGLDPIMQRVLVNLMGRAAADGTTIVFSSHQIMQVERVVERIGILDRGHLLLTGNVDDLLANHKVVEASFTAAPPIDALRRDPRVSVFAVEGNNVSVTIHRDPLAFERDICRLGATSVRSSPQTLEEIFVGAVGVGRVA
ncbi:MAG TPA: ABC transporter ATP-binding protein [Candidatus Baltobacteraceae bacterium]